MDGMDEREGAPVIVPQSHQIQPVVDSDAGGETFEQWLLNAGSNAGDTFPRGVTGE